jgi:hypothetical protein
MVWTRYVVPLEPIATTTADDIAAWLGPTFQLYLHAPLDHPAQARH